MKHLNKATDYNILDYTPDVGAKLTNTDSLPRGTGSRYLEALKDHRGGYIAMYWRRTRPANIPEGHLLIRFKES